MHHIPPTLFPTPETRLEQLIVLRNVIKDRGSSYSVMADIITERMSHKTWFASLKSDKFYAKATHNSYARRSKLSDGSIVEGRNDDGETGAGQIILREMQRVNAVDMIIVVTRYFGGVMLHGDRFRHVVDASKMILDEITK